jgi:hypothetical protein
MALLTFSSLHFTVVVDMLWVVAPWMSKRCILDTHSVAPLWKNVLKTFPPMALLSFLTLHLTGVVDMIGFYTTLPRNMEHAFLAMAFALQVGGWSLFLLALRKLDHAARLFSNGVFGPLWWLLTVYLAGLAQTRSCSTPV